MTISKTQTSVLVTGATGYFGGVAAAYFRDIGCKVITASRHEGSDIFLDLDYPEVFADLKLHDSPDILIHAAAAHEVTCVEMPYRAVYQNVAGTKAALDFCLKNNIKTFVYLSTFHVYGDPTGTLDESVEPYPANDYGLTHYQAEQYVAMYARKHGIRGIVVRPTNFFGVPAETGYFNRWTLVPLAFCREAIDAGTISLKTPGYQMRNFVSVKHICAVIADLVFTADAPPVVHIYGRENISIRDLALLVKDVCSRKIGIDVRVVVPYGTPCLSDFVFTSRYSYSDRTSDNLEDFIFTFCELLKKGRTGAVSDFYK